MTRILMEGSEAMAQAAIAAGCRFFAGYPMTPFTELLESFGKVVAGSRWGRDQRRERDRGHWDGIGSVSDRAPGQPQGSTGQGLALMQESLSELTRSELPLVYFNMARGHTDYYQATRGGGHGDYRHMVLAPIDVHEAVAADPTRLRSRGPLAQSGSNLRRLLPRTHE